MTQKFPLLELGDEFYTPVKGGAFSHLQVRYRNQTQAQRFDLNQLSDSEWLQHFGQFLPLNNNLSTPLAMKYHGHQFQHYNPNLGDGRGFVFAQFLENQHLFELGTKGSGQTPYSRRGDGRLTLKGAVRELLATDFLEKQNVLTSKTFSIVETGETLERHDEPSPTRSAVLFRLSRGHIRIGNFQRAHYFQSQQNILKLVDYSVKYFYPEISNNMDGKAKIEQFFDAVTLRMADLCASYMVAGFVHGVLNTDNMNISGESFDYGPYRFLPCYDPHFTAAYFDHEGLYCFGQQPPTFLWNLTELRKTLLFAQPDADLTNLERHFTTYFNVLFTSRFFKKMNLTPLVNSSESQTLKAFQKISPSYYNENSHPILDTKEILSLPFEEISQSVFFSHTQRIIENYFQDLYGDKNKKFEASFFELLKWTHNSATTTFFSPKTLNLINTHTSLTDRLDDAQINTRNESLIIEEIESIWSEIELKDNWGPLYKKIKAEPI
ncbi:MAG: YdiU family protein [Bdellovibrionaceae bacterium]|nr:YdiU family protein [Pseudobdellovibrionaceae bacterium]